MLAPSALTVVMPLTETFAPQSWISAVRESSGVLPIAA